ncbi:LrgB family protein [Bdellovibrio bacteriovorus]|uniref:LrgB family protein n=1 Tax=Bdellovibrio bacteriovorus TaxID=959 RepID=UPI0035A5B19D
MMELLALIMTLGFYLAARRISSWGKDHPLLSPPVLTILAVIIMLLVFKIPYKEYFQSARPIHFMLGPATVALALPLYNQLEKLKKVLAPLMVALVIGSTVGILSAVFFGALFGLPHDVLLALTPKSVTTPIAMGIAEKIGGAPSLATVFVMITGIAGAIVATTVMKLVRVQDPVVKGFAMGLAAHGLGTVRAFQISEMAGAFAGLAMALNGLMTAILVPLLLSFIP